MPPPELEGFSEEQNQILYKVFIRVDGCLKKATDAAVDDPSGFLNVLNEYVGWRDKRAAVLVKRLPLEETRERERQDNVVIGHAMKTIYSIKYVSDKGEYRLKYDYKLITRPTVYATSMVPVTKFQLDPSDIYAGLSVDGESKVDPQKRVLLGICESEYRLYRDRSRLKTVVEEYDDSVKAGGSLRCISLSPNFFTNLCQYTPGHQCQVQCLLHELSHIAVGTTDVVDNETQKKAPYGDRGIQIAKNQHQGLYNAENVSMFIARFN